MQDRDRPGRSGASDGKKDEAQIYEILTGKFRTGSQPPPQKKVSRSVPQCPGCPAPAGQFRGAVGHFPCGTGSEVQDHGLAADGDLADGNRPQAAQAVFTFGPREQDQPDAHVEYPVHLPIVDFSPLL